MQEDHYLTELVRYIHKNPLKAKLVECLSQFKWSSHQSYVKNEAQIMGLDVDFVLRIFSGKRKIAIERYKRFMTEKESAEVEKFYGAKKQSPILGDADFRE